MTCISTPSINHYKSGSKITIRGLLKSETGSIRNRERGAYRGETNASINGTCVRVRESKCNLSRHRQSTERHVASPRRGYFSLLSESGEWQGTPEHPQRPPTEVIEQLLKNSWYGSKLTMQTGPTTEKFGVGVWAPLRGPTVIDTGAPLIPQPDDLDPTWLRKGKKRLGWMVPFRGCGWWGILSRACIYINLRRVQLSVR